MPKSLFFKRLIQCGNCLPKANYANSNYDYTNTFCRIRAVPIPNILTSWITWLELNVYNSLSFGSILPNPLNYADTDNISCANKINIILSIFLPVCSEVMYSDQNCWWPYLVIFVSSKITSYINTASRPNLSCQCFLRIEGVSVQQELNERVTDISNDKRHQHRRIRSIVYLTINLRQIPYPHEHAFSVSDSVNYTLCEEYNKNPFLAVYSGLIIDWADNLSFYLKSRLLFISCS